MDALNRTMSAVAEAGQKNSSQLKVELEDYAYEYKLFYEKQKSDYEKIFGNVQTTISNISKQISDLSKQIADLRSRVVNGQKTGNSGLAQLEQSAQAVKDIPDAYAIVNKKKQELIQMLENSKILVNRVDDLQSKIAKYQ